MIGKQKQEVNERNAYSSFYFAVWMLVTTFSSNKKNKMLNVHCDVATELPEKTEHELSAWKNSNHPHTNE